MKRDYLRPLALASCLVLLALAACTPAVKAPGFDLRGVVADSSSGLLITIAVSNPNRFELKAQDLEYRVFIDSNVCGSGRLAGPIQVPGRDTVDVEFPLQVNLENVIRSLPAVLNDTVNIRVEGNYSAVTPLGLRRLTLNRGKRIAIRDEFKTVMRRLFQ